VRGFLFLIIATSLLAQGQIKEINILGKDWHLVGYDLRIKPRLYTKAFFLEQFENAQFPSPAYLEQYDLGKVYLWTDLPRTISTVSVGAVFRPFLYSKIKFVKQVEIAHNIEYEHLSQKMSTDLKSGMKGSPLFYTANNIGYNPRLLISSPTVAESLKFYLTGDAYGYLPLSNLIYTVPNDSFLPNGSGNYKKADVRYTDRVVGSSFKYGVGLGLGVKINVSCKWNFHLEWNTADVYTRHTSNKKTTQAGFRGVQFGLRYKFGVPSDDDSEESSNPSSFW